MLRGQAEKLAPHIYAHKLNYQNTKVNFHYRKQHLPSRTINCSLCSTEYYFTALVHNAMLLSSIFRHFQSNLYIKQPFFGTNSNPNTIHYITLPSRGKTVHSYELRRMDGITENIPFVISVSIKYREFLYWLGKN